MMLWPTYINLHIQPTDRWDRPTYSKSFLIDTSFNITMSDNRRLSAREVILSVSAFYSSKKRAPYREHILQKLKT